MSLLTSVGSLINKHIRHTFLRFAYSRLRLTDEKNGRTLQQEAHTSCDNAERLKHINFVRGIVSFLKLSVLFQEVHDEEGWKLKLSCAKFVSKGHIDVHSNDTFTKTILGQKFLLKYEELH